MRFFLFVCLFFASVVSYAQEKINVLLIATNHFDNPGNDVGKAVDRNILTEKNQKELEFITGKIAKDFKPSKVFAEYPYGKRKELDIMYQQYANGKSYFNADSLTPKKAKFFKENEIFQFSFKLAKKANNKSVYAIDTMLNLKFDVLFKYLASHKELNDKFQADLAKMTAYFNNCLEKDSQVEAFLCMNDEKQNLLNKSFYISFVNKLGVDNDYFGANFVTDWYKRNLLMYANFQTQLEDTDKNVVLMAGAGHTAMIIDFIKNDPRFNLVEFKDIFKK
ncbi:MAG: hypothetical protein EOO96_03295 [Pedobacter sp.]|nr:MAG: hypothetical protein EOO96_03295 [Pedobacter sp.]